MDELRSFVLPSDPVGIGILVVTGLEPLSITGILGALAHVGAPSWRPVNDVVATAIDRLCQHGLLVPASRGTGGMRLAPAAAVRAQLPDLLDRLPLSGGSPDIGYKLKVMGLGLLDPASQVKQLELLVAHWHDVAAFWRNAEDFCPCTHPSVRGWMQHNIRLASAEIDWLMSVSPGATSQLGRH